MWANKQPKETKIPHDAQEISQTLVKSSTPAKSIVIVVTCCWKDKVKVATQSGTKKRLPSKKRDLQFKWYKRKIYDNMWWLA